MHFILQLTTLLGGIGGILGVYMGFSFLALFELFDVFGKFLCCSSETTRNESLEQLTETQYSNHSSAEDLRKHSKSLSRNIIDDITLATVNKARDNTKKRIIKQLRK